MKYIPYYNTVKAQMKKEKKRSEVNVQHKTSGRNVAELSSNKGRNKKY